MRTKSPLAVTVVRPLLRRTRYSTYSGLLKSRISKRIRGRATQQRSCLLMCSSAIRRRLISVGDLDPLLRRTVPSLMFYTFEEGVSSTEMMDFPPIYGRSTSGILTEPSSFRLFSRKAISIRGGATTVLFNVCAKYLPFSPTTRIFNLLACASPRLEQLPTSKYFF